MHHSTDSTWVTVRQESSQVFEVLGCRDVKIIFAKHQYLDTSYARGLTIGSGGDKTIITNQWTGEIIKEEDTPNILDCDVCNDDYTVLFYLYS